MNNGLIGNLVSQCQASTLMIRKWLAVKLHQLHMSSHFDKAGLQGEWPPGGCRDSIQKCILMGANLPFGGYAL